MKQSPNDAKQYKTITLANGLRVLLIQNKQSNKAAAALAVNVGHFSDPVHRQGLAHFLEHMLFLGTSKYPDGSEYQKFISQHGGANNAWTGTEHTCFFFDIHHLHFEHALDRFSQFFISPLLSTEFIEKERENIDAEYKLKLKDDIRRLYDVHKETINPEHPFAKFSVGTSDTLKDIDGTSISAEVSSFFETNYYAKFMTLVIESPNDIEQLENWAKQYFIDIRSTTKKLLPVTQPLYLPENQQQFIYVKPVKNDHQLIVSFAMPSIDEYYREKPESVLAYLLGYEGKGSILSLLKQKQWAVGLTAGSGINGSNFKDFNISMPLTELGEAHIDDIIEIIFSYIALIKSKPIAEHYYQDKKAISDLSFLYQEKMSPIDTVSQLVINMQHYTDQDTIYGDYVMDGLNHENIAMLINYLVPTNMRVTYISQQNEVEKVSKWYQVPYRVCPFENKQLNKWQTPQLNRALYLPEKNPYIVTKPKILPVEQGAKNNQLPQLIKQQNGLNLWFKQDQTFNVPKGYVYVGLDSPITIKNTTNIAMTRLFVDIYSDAIVEEHYDAELAGIHYHLYSHQGGLSLQLSGLSEKQGDLLATLLKSLKNAALDEKRFKSLKEQLLNHWTNSDKSKSISQLFAVLSSALQPSNPSAAAMHKALEKVTFEQFIEFSTNIFKDVSLNILIHGNWHQSSANAMCDTIFKALIEKGDTKHLVEVPLIDTTGEGEITLPLLLPEHDHASVIYYPMQDKSATTIAKTIITSQLFSPLFFQKMRTEKQYGYLVGVGYVPIHNYPGIAFYIQSPHTSSTELISAMDEFINQYQDMLTEISADEWQHLQHGLASQLQEKDTSLRIRSQRFWAAICNNDLTFSHKQQVIDALLTLTFEDITTFIKESLLPTSSPDRVNLMTFLDNTSIENNASTNKVITNVEEIINNFKRKQ